MSTKYPGGIITKNYTAPTPTSASGIWTLEQQEQAKQAGIWPYGGPFNYIEDVFSTYLYAGTGATQTITNNIDLSTYGGLVWSKSRSGGVSGNGFVDTARGATKCIFSNTTGAQATVADSLTAFTSTGYTLGADASVNAWNTSGYTYAGWTFRKQPKFFDIVTYTGDGTAGRAISHNLGSTPGCIMIKCTSVGYGWVVGHRSAGWSNSGALQSADPFGPNSTTFNSTDPTSAVFSVGGATGVNQSGQTYVAYLFAHDAGGFGLAGTDNVISCGSFVPATGVDSTITLGYEPQWVLIKKSTTPGSDWRVFDNMRGMGVSTSTSDDANLYANLADTEIMVNVLYPTATGFVVPTTSTIFDVGSTYIYVAIRRGPMKVPTDGTKVFATQATAAATTGNNKSTYRFTSGFPVDLLWQGYRAGSVNNVSDVDRLRGFSVDTATTPFLTTSSTNAENAGSTYQLDNNNGITTAGTLGANSTFNAWMFRRAPSFFDIVCYTGTGANRTVTHNLGVAPELVILKTRAAVNSWTVGGSVGLVAGSSSMTFTTNAATTAFASTYWNSTAPTSSVVSLGNGSQVNASGGTFVMYLFASCPGVSKVGSYTGTGTTQTIDCGFTGGARFVLIKDITAAQGWYVWDTARGMVSGTDPSLQLQSTSAEANANWVYTTSVGFQIVTSNTNINASGDTYIYLAIA